MKIGILTFHLGPNHGGYLQAYCLCKYIKSMGHDVEIINYKNAHHYERETFRPWVYRRPFKLYNAWIKERIFQKSYLELPLSEFSTDVDAVDWNQYDVVVIGSDVVFDFTWDWLGQDHVYFGHFGKNDYHGKRVAYAPSAGTTPPDAAIPEWVSSGLSQFDGLSARDETAQSIIKRACGNNVPLVVDPTWLDMEYSSEPVTKEKTLVIYAFEVKESEKKAIVAYAKKYGLKIIALGYYLSWADENNMKLGPLEWPEVMRRAEVVVAGTFHGTLYAIKTQSQFVVLWNERIKYRVKRPLALSELEGRILKNAKDLDWLLQSPIDYCQVMDKLQPYVQSSREYLSANLV